MLLSTSVWSYAPNRSYNVYSDIPTSYHLTADSREIRHFYLVKKYLYNENYVGLRDAIQKGLDINARDEVGNTPLCEAIKKEKHQFFHVLKSLGADLSSECLNKIDLQKRKNFLAMYRQKGGILSQKAYMQLTQKTGTNWKIVGGVAGCVAVAGGITALALSGGGGGGGSSGGSSSGGNSAGDTPTPAGSHIVAEYETNEFAGSYFSGSANFLSAINAQYAYAGLGGNAGDGISVAVIDVGVDVNHTELKNNIKKDGSGNTLGYNTNYGPCRGTDRKNCWLVNEDTFTAYFYGESGIAGSRSLSLTDYIAWLEYESLFPDDWNWDDHQNDATPPSKTSNHGTHVAGIIAAQKDNRGMHGVAYNAKIIPIQKTFGWYEFYTDTINHFKYAANNGAQIINNSWGISGNYMAGNGYSSVANNISSLQNSYEYDILGIDYAVAHQNDSSATKTPSVVVFAAGNDGENGIHPQAGIIGAYPMYNPSVLYQKDDSSQLVALTSYPTTQNEWNKIASSLFVVAVSVTTDATPQLAWYSQKCGAAARWCISAPGGTDSAKIASTSPDNEYVGMMGTSMATPVVSGSLAVIMGASPHLTPQEAVAILFESATDLGEAGVDEVYGWGEVNLKQALSPLGLSSIPVGNSANGEGVALSSSRVEIPRYFANFKNMPQTFLVLDKYKRGFQVSTDKFIRQTNHSKQAFANDLKAFTRKHHKQSIDLSNKVSFAFWTTNSSEKQSNLEESFLSLKYRPNENISFDFSFNGNAKTNVESYFEKGLSNPFTTSALNVWRLSNTFRLNENISLSWAGSMGDNHFFDGNERTDFNNQETMKTAEILLAYQPHKKVKIDFVGGVLNEKSSLLGMSGRGAFSTASNDTFFMGAKVNWSLLKDWQVGLAYYQGYSGAKKQNSFMSMSRVVSESFGVDTSYQFSKELTVGASVVSPLRVKKGKMMFDLPVARDESQDIVYRERFNADMSSTAREFDLGLYMTKQLGDFDWQVMTMARLYPDNEASAKPDYRVLMSLGFNY